jgi:hypothetical protein
METYIERNIEELELIFKRIQPRELQSNSSWIPVEERLPKE